MKLGNKRIFLLKTLLLLLFMIAISTMTINYLYKTNNITKEDYIKLLLSDTYGNDFCKKIVEIINNNFNPVNMIEMKEVKYKHFDLSNNINISNPLIYVYSNSQNDTYRKEYNINPTLYLTTYLLSLKLNELGKETLFENNDIYSFSNNNNITIEEAEKLFVSDKVNNYPSIKYIININRSVDYKRNTTISTNGEKYAIINLYANEKNISLITNLNSSLNKKYNGISKIYFDKTYNDHINIELGGNENNMEEVINSINALSSVFIEVTNEI